MIFWERVSFSFFKSNCDGKPARTLGCSQLDVRPRQAVT